jgi:hypothetical protein
VTSQSSFCSMSRAPASRISAASWGKIPTTSVRRRTVNLGAVTFTDSGGDGYVDRGETVNLTLPLRNSVTNPLNARRLDGLQGELSTTTPGVR